MTTVIFCYTYTLYIHGIQTITMNKLFRTCCGLLMILAGCNTLPPLPYLMSPSQLTSQFLDIDVQRDTTLTLKGGTIITIPAHALKVDNGRTARLEVKEALTIEDIIKAGLRTESNRQPLQSGGMIYINAAEGAGVSILQPIKVRIPADDIVEGMQLFKGDTSDIGVNWVDPVPLSSTTPLPDVSKGKALFQQNCASCHGVTNQVTGPALYGAMQRWKYDTASMYSFVHNSGSLIASGHCYAVSIFNEYNKQAMPGFPSLTDKDIQDIFDYIEQDGRKKLGPLPPGASQTVIDSCRYYRSVVKAANRPDFVTVNSDTTTQIIQPDTSAAYTESYMEDTGMWEQDTTSYNTDTLYIDIPEKRYVVPENNKSAYYNIEITKFGWYNIDKFIGDEKALMAHLSVSMNDSANQNVSVFLIIPSEKVMLQGGHLDDGKLYGFKETNGALPLPPGLEAYVIAIAESRDRKQLYFAKTRFITSERQELTLTLTPAAVSQVNAQIEHLRLPDFKLKVGQQQLTKDQKALQQEAQRVEDKLKYCQCGWAAPMPATTPIPMK